MCNVPDTIKTKKKDEKKKQTNKNTTLETIKEMKTIPATHCFPYNCLDRLKEIRSERSSTKIYTGATNSEKKNSERWGRL